LLSIPKALFFCSANFTFFDGDNVDDCLFGTSSCDDDCGLLKGLSTFLPDLVIIGDIITKEGLSYRIE